MSTSIALELNLRPLSSLRLVQLEYLGEGASGTFFKVCDEGNFDYYAKKDIVIQPGDRNFAMKPEVELMKKMLDIKSNRLTKMITYECELNENTGEYNISILIEMGECSLLDLMGIRKQLMEGWKDGRMRN